MNNKSEKMTKEIYHEGWLIQSSPKNYIWPSRLKRRWFILKQIEIPKHFRLEYYKDRSCRKLKGSINLEQVESNLQLEYNKREYEHMFFVKTPLRTYHLAANSEEDMIAWVNCIREVRNLQDLWKSQRQIIGANRQYYNEIQLSYSPKCNNFPSIQQASNENVFTDDEKRMTITSNNSTNGDCYMRSSESTVGNDAKVFTHAQNFSKMKKQESTTKKVDSKLSIPIAALSLKTNDFMDRNKEVNSPDAKNLSKATTCGPKDTNFSIDKTYHLPDSHQISSIKLAATVQDDNQLNAPVVDRKLKPKIHHDDAKPPFIYRKLKPCQTNKTN